MHRLQQRRTPNLLQRLVVDKMRGVLGDFELPLLDMLAELPVRRARDVKTAYRHVGRLEVMAKHDTQDLGIITYIVAKQAPGPHGRRPGKVTRTDGTTAEPDERAFSGERRPRTSRTLLAEKHTTE